MGFSNKVTKRYEWGGVDETLRNQANLVTIHIFAVFPKTKKHLTQKQEATKSSSQFLTGLNLFIKSSNTHY